MAKRKAISKKLRFDIFKRDSFQCQYCGTSPPNVILEIDHIIPISGGGDNDSTNLVTSCFDCNRGKSDRRLESVPESLSDITAREKEMSDQLDEIRKQKQLIRDRNKRHLAMINQEFMAAGYIDGLSGDQIISIKTNFLPRLDVIDICEAAEIAAMKFDRLNKSYRYFCGICWNRIRSNQDG